MIEFNDNQLSKLPQVTSSKLTSIFRNKKIFHEEGLFSEKIFGPINDYECTCGKYNGKLYEGIVCEECGVTITTSSVRSKNMATIKLPFKVLKPNVILSNVNRYEKLLAKYEHLLLSSEKEQSLLHEYVINNEYNLYNKNKKKDITLEEFQQEYTTSYVVVIPVTLRPISLSFEVVSESVNEYYRSLISHIEEYGKTHLLNYELDIKIYRTYIALLKELKKKLGGKEGFIRERVLGRRPYFSSRCVITPDPYLVDRIRIPYKVLVHILEPHLHTSEVQPILNYLELIKSGKYDFPEFNEIKKEIQALCAKYYFVICRAPTLHSANVQAFQAEPTTENSLAIANHAVLPFNGDFDGDSVIGNVKLYDEDGNMLFNDSLAELEKLTIKPKLWKISIPSIKILVLILLKKYFKIDY